MQIKTILNRVERHPGFVYQSVKLVQGPDGSELDVHIRPRAGSQPQCSVCGVAGPGYDTLPPVRRFQFVPLWGLAVYFLYAMRRVNCAVCGIRVERVPWARGKNTLTISYAWFLARWAKRMAWKSVADAFRTSWDNVERSVEMAVAWGRAHMDLSGVCSIGVDELHHQHGQKYLTLVYQIDEHCKRLLWIGRERTENTLRGFFSWFGQERAARLEFICSDMWKPYLTVIAEKASQAVHVLDRFHIMSHFSKAIDQVRAGEARLLKARGFFPVLKHTRWLLLKRPEHLTDSQDIKLAELLRYNLATVRSYLLKESFQFFWDYVSPYWAGRYLDRWCFKTMRSRIEPMKTIARMLRSHRSLILNWFRARGAVSAGCVEGLNNKARVTTRRAYGFRTEHTAEIALYHTLGNLPEPEFTHRFC